MQNYSQKSSDVSFEKAEFSLNSYTISNSKEFMKEILSFDYNESNYKNMLTSFESAFLSQEKQYESKILVMSQTITSLQQEIIILNQVLAQKDKEISNFQTSKELSEVDNSTRKRSLLNRSAVMDTNLQKRESVVRKHGYAVVTKKQETAVERVSLPKKESTLQKIQTSDSGWELRWEKQWKENNFKEVEESKNLLSEIEKAVSMGNLGKCLKNTNNDDPLLLLSRSQIKEEICELDKIVMNLNKNHHTLEKKIKQLVSERNFLKEMNGDLANNILNQQKIINDYESLLKASYSYSKESTNINYDLSSLFQKLININGCSKDIILTIEDFFKKINFQPNIDKLNIILLGLQHNFKEKFEKNSFFKIKKTPSVKYSPKFPTPDDESNKENVNTNNREDIEKTNEDMYQSKNIKSPLKNIRSVSEFKQNSAESLFEKNLLNNEELDKKFLILTEEKTRLQNEVDFLKKSQEFSKNQPIFGSGDIKYRNTLKKSQDLIQFMNKIEKNNGSLRDFLHASEKLKEKDEEFANVVMEDDFMDLEKKLAQLQNEIESLNTQIKQKEIEAISLKQENEDLINQINCLQKDILLLNEKNQNILEDLKRKYDTLLENNQLSIERIQKNDDYEQKYNSIFEECSQMREEMKYWQNSSSNNNLRKENSEISEKNSKNEQFEIEFHNVNLKYQELQKQHEEMEKEFEAMKNAQEIMLNLVRSKEEKIQDFNKKYELLNENYKNVQFTNDELRKTIENYKQNEEENLLSELEVLKKFEYFEKINEKSAHKEINEKECQTEINRKIEELNEKAAQTENDYSFSNENIKNYYKKMQEIDAKQNKKNIKILETKEIGVQYEENDRKNDHKIIVFSEKSEKETQYEEIEENDNNEQRKDYERKFDEILQSYKILEKEKLEIEENYINLNKVLLETRQKEEKLHKFYSEKGVQSEMKGDIGNNEAIILENEKKNSEILEKYHLLQNEKNLIEKKLAELENNRKNLQNKDKEVQTEPQLQENKITLILNDLKEKENKYNELSEKYHFLQNEKDIIEKTLSDIKEENENFKKKLIISEENHEKNLAYIHELEQKIKILQSDNEILLNKNQVLGEEKLLLEESLNNHKKNSEKEIEIKNKTIIILQKDIDHLQIDKAAFENEKKKFDQIEHFLKNKINDYDEIYEKYMKLREESNEIRKQLVNTQKDYFDLQENCEKTKKIQENKSIQTDNYMKKVAFLEIKLIFLTRNLQNFHKEHEKIPEIMQKLSLENSRLLSENACLSRQIESFQKSIYKNSNINKENINIMSNTELPPTNKLSILKNDWENQLNLLLKDEKAQSSNKKSFIPLIYENHNNKNQENGSNLNDVDFLMKKIKRDHENSKNTIKNFYETILFNLLALFCFFIENILRNEPYININLEFLLNEKKIESNLLIKNKIKDLNCLLECFSDYQNAVVSNEFVFLNKVAPTVSTESKTNLKVFSVKYQNFKNNLILSKII